MADHLRTVATDRRPRSVGAVVSCALVGGEELFLDLLAAMLQLRRGLRIVARETSAAAALSADKGRTPDILVLDAGSLASNTFEDIRAALDRAPGVRLLVIGPTSVAAAPGPWIAKRPHAVVSRNSSFQDFLQQLESLFSDGSLPRAESDDGFRHKALTDREAEVMALMGDGLTTREIAAALGRSVFTIQTHRKRIAEKLGRLGCSLTQRVAAHRNTHFKGRSPKH